MVLAEFQPPHAQILAALGVGTWDWHIVEDHIHHDAAWRAFLGMEPTPQAYDFAAFRRLIHPDDFATVEARVREALDHDAVYRCVYRMVRADGAILWIEDAGRVVARDADGTARRMVGAIRDITETVATQRALRASEARFDHVAANIPGVVFSYVRPPDGPDRMAYVSQGAIDVWELSPEETIADVARLWRMIDPADLPAMAASVDESARKLGGWDHRWRMTTPSGRRKWLHGRGTPARHDDGTIEWFSFLIDVTEQVAMEEALAESREALFQAQKLEAIGNLSGGIAHDFNNLLFVVLGNLELILDSDDPALRRECLEDAIAATLRGRELTTSLLTFARRAPLQAETIDLNAVIRGMRDLVRRTLPATIEVEVELAPDLACAVLDPFATENALLNLIINARDAMPAGGHITIATANVHVAAEPEDGCPCDLAPGDYAAVRISDTGAGIAPEHLDDVFVPFFTTKEVGKGTGLGLPMVLGFAQQSGGTVHIHSEMGVGTTVEALFRAAVRTQTPATPPATPSAAAPTVAPAAPGSGERVLLVEDDAAVRATLAARLRRDGYAVREAGSGREALQTFERDGPFDVVLCDVVMPGQLQGPALIQRLRRTIPGLPAVLMSGYPAAAAMQGAHLLPNDILLRKPIRAEELRAALSRALRCGGGGASGPRRR